MPSHDRRPTAVGAGHDAPPVPAVDLGRRAALRRLLGVAAGAALAAGSASAFAQMQHGHGHGAMGGAAPDGSPAGATPPPPGAGAGHPHAHDIPWDDGRCAFCGMTLATPTGGAMAAGFRERTYAQWAFDGEARHFESIGCAFGWAYAHGVVDGEGAALHVAAYDQAARPDRAELLRGADAAYLWAERLPASMMARLGAFASPADAEAFAAARRDELGRRRIVDLTLLADLAPLPIANLLPLLQRQLG